MKRYLLLLLLPALLATTWPVLAAQEEPPPGGQPPVPLVHTVQEGENLTFIAENYGVTLADLLLVNNLTEEAVLQVGQTLIIPGGEGEAVAAAYTVRAGDSAAAIAADFNTSAAAVLQANRGINPQQELVAGQGLSLLSRTGSALPEPLLGRPYVVEPGDTPLAIAASSNLTTTALLELNDLAAPTYLFPGQRLRLPGEGTYRRLPGEWVDVQVRPQQISQGATVSIYVENLLDGRPSSTLDGQTLRFVPWGAGYVALAGLDAFAEPGIHTLELAGAGERPWSPMSQRLLVADGEFGVQSITVTDELSYLLNPVLRQDEDDFLRPIYTTFSETPLWEGLFQFPISPTIVTGAYGAGRSYNEGPVEIYHTGVDFGAAVGTPVLAPAAGIVVFSGAVQLRGNIVIIDHGLGVKSGFFHLSDRSVTLGQEVAAGEQIGELGSTGLSSGPHLHWDLRILDVPVDALQWTQQEFP